MSDRSRGTDGIPQREALRLFLATVAGNDRGGYVEVRSKAERGMAQSFFRTTRLEPAVELIPSLAQRTDVFVGMAPRSHRHGGRSAVRAVYALWADCDAPESVHALSGFEPAPSIIVKSGSVTGGVPHVHATWQLREPLVGEHAERANRRLAHALGADMRSCDMARILRPPATLNHKTAPARPVVCIRMEATTFTAAEIVGNLPDPPIERRSARRSGTPIADETDPLRAIPASLYVPWLTGREVGRDGKARCPFHEDRIPSLHAYADAERGWTCFGCGKGGTIIDFGAALYGLAPRGRDFHEIRRRLAADLLATGSAAA